MSLKRYGALCGRRFRMISICAFAIVVFVFSQWRSYEILSSKPRGTSSRGYSFANFSGVARNKIGTARAPNYAFTDPICRKKGASFPATCGKGVLGIKSSEVEKYQSSVTGKFSCLESGEQISWSAVNDDFCDCIDGSDEPGTGACPNTRFYCLPEEKYIPASRINDGLCDCCDGSDEWKRFTVGQDVLTHHKIDIAYSPCQDVCVKTG